MAKYIDTFDKLSVNGEQSRTIDLHTHTIHSDGALTPTALVEKAAEIGLAAIAVADHENTAGIEEARKEGEKLGIEVVPAVEMTSYPDPKTEHHILGYFVDYRDKKLQRILKEVRDSRENRAKKVVENLNRLGYSINFGDVKALASGTIVQPHIAWVVINDLQNRPKLKKDFGYSPTTGEFIRKYLTPGSPAYEPREALSPKEAIDLIHDSSGLAVFAHPCWTVVTKEEDKLIFHDKKFEEIVKAGLDGVEALAHRDSEADTKACVAHFTKLAQKFKLVVTGGSDFHGFGSAGKKLGFEGFYLKVPYSILENVKKYV